MTFETISIFFAGFGCGGIIAFLLVIRTTKKSIDIIEQYKERIASLEEQLESLKPAADTEEG